MDLKLQVLEMCCLYLFLHFVFCNEIVVAYTISKLDASSHLKHFCWQAEIVDSLALILLNFRWKPFVYITLMTVKEKLHNLLIFWKPIEN